MNETSNIVALRQPDDIDDPLTNILRAGARQLLAQAVEIEVETFVATEKDLKLAVGSAGVVRHGYGPARTIATGIGPVEVARAKIRDRGAAGDGERIRFNSAILPLWARRTRSLDALLPVLYLRGISTGDFQEALTALLGKDAPNLSPSVISRLTAEWQGEYERELSPNFGDGRSRSGGGGCGLTVDRLGDDLDPVVECHTENEFWQLVGAVETAPAFLRGFQQF